MILHEPRCYCWEFCPLDISKRLCIVALLEDGKDGEVDLGFSTSWRAVHLDSLLFFLYLRIACEVSQRLTHCLPLHRIALFLQLPQSLPATVPLSGKLKSEYM